MDCAFFYEPDHICNIKKIYCASHFVFIFFAGNVSRIQMKIT